MPRVTLAEIDATGRKAARGCGCPWGLAEEAGKAARWLCAHGLPGAEDLAAILSAQATCCTKGGPPCALRTGATLADRAPLSGSEPLALSDSAHPWLIVAQMGQAAEALGLSFVLTWDGTTVTVAPHGLATDNGTTPRTPAARDVEASAWATLKALSHRTLVPASDASRAGAGAGTRDND